MTRRKKIIAADKVKLNFKQYFMPKIIRKNGESIVHIDAKNLVTEFDQQIADAEAEMGQLSVDVYESKDQLLIVAPVAGVKLSDINLSLTDDVLTISGERKLDLQIPAEEFLIQECFWGAFSRSIVLPDNVDTTRISAGFKDGILKVSIPKVPGPNQTRLIKIKTDV